MKIRGYVAPARVMMEKFELGPFQPTILTKVVHLHQHNGTLLGHPWHKRIKCDKFD